jgi:phage terminase small subunit
MPKKSLTARCQAFIRYYLAGKTGVRGNATKSAQAAGYSKKTAYAQGCRLLKNAEVRKAIKSKQREADARVVRELVDWTVLAIGAQETMEGVRSGKIKKGAVVRLMAADKILDRTFGKPPTKVQHSGAVTLAHALEELE